MESQPQNPEFSNNPKKFHLRCIKYVDGGQCQKLLPFHGFKQFF